MSNLGRGIPLALAVALGLWGCDAPRETGEDKRSPETLSREIVRIAVKQIPPPDALAKVGDRYVRLADYERHSAQLPPRLAESEQGRSFVMKQIIDNLLVEKEAEARGLTEDPVLVARIEDFARNLYKNALTDSLKGSRTSITDEEAKEYFLEREDEIIQPERARVSLIQLSPDKEKEIKALHNELRAGKDFAEIARTHSKHVSASRGGELGFLTRGQFKELTDVAFNTKPGDISKPFKVPTGWAIIKVHEIITKEKITLEEGIRRAKARLDAVEASKRFDALMTDLRAKHRVTLYEDRIKGLQP
jgi:peptidyl-prolyl cis-trans isomerase C